MKTTLPRPALTAIVLAAWVGTGQAAPPASAGLSKAEAQGLVHMREEEKLARDVYLTLGTIHRDAVFSRIAESEQRHMAAIRQQLLKYGLDDPVRSDNVGAFSSKEFGTLYKQLVEQGRASPAGAYRVGALIEELDIADLHKAQKDVTHADLRFVYENLTRGSRNHLRAFASRLQSQGQTYKAVHLDQKEFDAIARSPQEPGGGRGRGRGQGQSRGYGRGRRQGRPGR